MSVCLCVLKLIKTEMATVPWRLHRSFSFLVVQVLHTNCHGRHLSSEPVQSSTTTATTDTDNTLLLFIITIKRLIEASGLLLEQVTSAPACTRDPTSIKTLSTCHIRVINFHY